jgi:hypothetical protein
MAKIAGGLRQREREDHAPSEPKRTSDEALVVPGA